MVSIFALLHVLQIQAINLEGFIVTSQITPPLLTQALRTIQCSNTTFQFLQYSDETLDYIKEFPPVFIVDASSSLIFSYHLQSLSQILDVFLFKIGKPQEKDNRSQWTFYSSPTLQYENQALDALVDYFDWESFHLFSSENQYSLTSAKHFKNNFGVLDGDLHILSPLLSLDIVVHYIGRLIKPTGNWKMLIFNEKESSQNIDEALKKMKMMQKGCGVILKFSGLTEVNEGLIVVAQKGTQSSSDFYDFQVKEVQLMISLLQDIFQQFSLNDSRSNDKVRQELEKLTEKGGRIPKYLILNSKEENILIQVGTIENSEVRITGNFTLPGGQTQFTNDVLQIRYSQHSGYVDYEGRINLNNYIFMSAIWIYLDIINSDDSQFQNFKLVSTDVYCGSSVFNYDYFKQCYQGFRNWLGVFFLHPSSPITLEVVKLWRQIELTTFQIGFFQDEEQIYNKEQYPQIVLSTITERVLYGFLPTFISYHGWKNLIVVQSKSNHEIGVSQSFYQSCNNLEIKIWNSQQTRIIPDNYNAETDYQTYKHYFQEYYDSGVRVIAMLSMYFQFVDFIYSLYQIGFRQGDIQIFSLYEPEPIITGQLGNYDSQSLKKIYSLLNGVVWRHLAQYVDQYQYSLKPLVQQALGTDTVDTSCYAMDMLQLGAYAVDNLLITGRDYQDENLVNESVRMQRFPGCTGTFSIDSSSNERRDTLNILGYTLYNIETGESFRYERGTFSPVQNPVFQVYGEFEYSNGSTTPPSDMRFQEWECEFPKQFVQKNEESMNLQAILVSVVIVLSILVSLIFFFIFRPKQGFQISSEQNVMSLGDLIYILSVAIESIQYLMIGPDFSKLNPRFYLIGNYISISFINVYSWRFERFWIFYNVFLGIASVWILSILIYFITFINRINGRMMLFFKEILEKVMPKLPNLLLVPILMILLKVVDCEEGISEKLSDSFLRLDCDTFCWEGNHLQSVVWGLIAIFFLCFLTLSYRLIQSQYAREKNIWIQPQYNYIKGILQLILVSLHSVLRKRFPLVFNVVFCVIVTGLLLYSYKFTVYNHKRLQLIQIFVAVGLLWSILLTTIFDLVTKGEINSSNQIVFSVFQMSGLALILLLFYIIYKKQPEMFYKFKIRYNVTELFRFMFGKQDLRRTLSIINRRPNKYRSDDVHEEEKSGIGTIGMMNFTF